MFRRTGRDSEPRAPGQPVARPAVVLASLAALCAGCSSGAIGGPSGGGGGGSGTGSFGSPNAPPFDAASGPISPPAQKGGYRLGAPIPYASDAGTGLDGGIDMPGCATILGIVRDFLAWDGATRSGHPDFEHYTGNGARKGMVMSMLDPSRKPMYDPAADTFAPPVSSGKDAFNQWYRNVENVNKPYYIYFYLVPKVGEVYTFQSTPFFPLDWQGWGNQVNPHNFHFTTEVHTEFVYKAGQTFSFEGDDDLWVFVNDKLALDLGGPHPSTAGTITLDNIAAGFGLVQGQKYPLDLFHAERHTDQSNFRIETNITFVRCNVLVPDPPPR